MLKEQYKETKSWFFCKNKYIPMISIKSIELNMKSYILENVEEMGKLLHWATNIT